MSPATNHGCCVDLRCDAETCMELPPGRTCGDCRHRRRCTTFGFTPSEAETVCSFFPRRFVARVQATPSKKEATP